ncbi:hypothetical protein ACM39_12635 [Chryseobacterium sp. FH2]|uniref:lanthionine synthetase LanC family protein n=1 Tax=Chryseobacterium sp. FH2 TaxID=1674291 RepID=UPI00065AECFC|nr:lanthionine synthetase LanC family protein [Chryseobacterium sp. FH2]KMQ67694.1 hypothetical protein ACM39_12635 [Chryseobacterium sp. FH2]
MTIEKKILDIENTINEIWDKKPFVSDLSLFTGIGGIPIFYYMLYKYKNQPEYLQKIEEVINFIFERLNDDDVNIGPTYCLGIAGIGFMLNYLENTNEIQNIDFSEGLEVIDDILIDSVDHFLSYIDEINDSHKLDQIDFLHGITGISYYLLERINKGIDIEKLTTVFEKVSEIAQWDYSEALKVKDIDTIQEGLHKTNVGLAHGHTSFIILFSKFLEIYPSNNKIKQGLEASVKTVLLFKNDDKDGFCMFPSIAISKKTAFYNIHLGWCYGDQSVAYGLYKAGKTLNNEDLIEESKNIAYSTLKRETMHSALLNGEDCDAGFCHGTISVAYYHKKWYSVTNDERFLHLYNKFSNDTLLLANKPEGLAGYIKHLGDNETSNAIGLLDGIAGIGTFLIDKQLNDPSLTWDSIFLLN